MNLSQAIANGTSWTISQLHLADHGLTRDMQAHFQNTGRGPVRRTSAAKGLKTALVMHHGKTRYENPSAREKPFEFPFMMVECCI